MSVAELKVAILIVSDSVSKGSSEDRTTAGLRQVLESVQNATWNVTETAVVEDDPSSIRAKVREWVGGKVHLILTSGGTGFAVRDVTPEAIEPLMEKKAPGLVHAMLAASLEVTPFAMMSRPVAGVCGKSLIVTLPGSPKGAKENLEAIIKLLPHACMQISGADSRALHQGGAKKLERDAGIQQGSSHSHGPQSHGHSHDHGHGHGHNHGHTIPVAHTRPEDRPQQSNDPTAGPSRRYRQSPYPMVSVEEAINTILKETPWPSPAFVSLSARIAGCVLAEDVVAAEAVPPFRASIVDGYAMAINGDRPTSKGVFKVASASRAGSSSVIPLNEGEIARITTGAPLPPNANAVAMVEDTVLVSSTSDGHDEKEIEILTDDIKPGENVREVGSDTAAGSTILRAGSVLTHTGGELGLLASVGCTKVKVFQRPVVGVMSTGDEIVPPDQPAPLSLGQVRDCNRIVITAALQGWGQDVRDLGIAPDHPKGLEEQLRAAFATCDVVITTGGASMGEHDLLKPVLERALGGTIHFARVSMKPGKPTTFASVEVKDAHSGERTRKLLFSLPGNPASAIVTTAIFALPGLRKLCAMPPASASEKGSADQVAWKKAGLPRLTATLTQSVRCDQSRDEYVRVSVRAQPNGFVAETTGGQRSSRIGSVAGANGLAVLPAGGGTYDEGQQVDVVMIGDILW